jgi:2-polyprenyl-3-methyl-5-hydroxy-6-metoxy-1,4-benzoquinol methylase
MSFIFKNRSRKKEILDDFELQGNDLAQNLRELQIVNSNLGGYSVVKEGIEQIIEKDSLKGRIRVADIGCGGGDTLRELAKWSLKKGFSLELTGIDANKSAVNFAEDQSRDYPEISFKQLNIFSEEFKVLDYDIIMFNLFVHHFEEGQIIAFLKVCRDKKAVVLINDLQRSALAYTLFRLSSKVFNFSKISRHDGMLSIRKAFTRKDLRELLIASGFTQFTIKWKWAFRYQVIAWY